MFLGPILVFLLAALFWIAVPAGVFIFARRMLRAVERRSLAESQLAEVVERLRRLEERVEQVESENERLTESQRFTTALLTQRSGPPTD